MSGRSSSGSRFQVLEENDDESESDDSSVYEMKLSREYYPTQIQAVSPKDQTSSRSSSSSGSSVHEMNLSRDNYSFPTLPSAGTSGGGAHPDQLSSRTSFIGSRSMQMSGTSPPKDQSGLEFVWDHFKRETQPIEEEGVDALGNMFGQESTSEVTNRTSNIEGDIIVLRNTGFNIEYPGGLLGRGFYGAVYSGTYGVPAPGITQNRFAVKIIDLGHMDDEDSRTLRELFETEKYILTTAVHQNIVSIRMIINMGDIRSFPFRDDPNQTFLSPDRVYMIMDFADFGELETFVNRNKATIDLLQRIDWIRDMFAGMLYLHSKEIAHGDVHAGNVLLFNQHGDVVAKWSDFGLGFVGSNKQFRYKLEKGSDITLKLRLDLDGMCALFSNLIKDRNQTTDTPEEKKLVASFLKMIKMMRKERITSLEEVHKKYKPILEDELHFDEQHFE